VRDRPKQDREALNALALEMDPSVESVEFSVAECPCYTAEFLEAKKREIDIFSSYEDRFAAIFDDGFVIQLDCQWANIGLPKANFFTGYLFGQLASSVVRHNEGNAEKKMKHLENSTFLVQGLSNTPHLAPVIKSAFFEKRLHETIVFLLPSMTKEEITTVRNNLSGLPNGNKSLLNAFKVEMVATVELLGQMSKGMRIAEITEGKDREFSPMFDDLSKFIAQIPFYYDRERYMYQSLAIRDIEALEAWESAGGEGEPPSVIKQDIETCMVALLAWPNAPYLMKKMVSHMRKRLALVEAMEAELNRRETDPKPEIEIPYGDDAKIVLKSEYGCIVENKTPAGGTDARARRVRQ
jgi:hypothetical protein